jgi:hypothetical protein
MVVTVARQTAWSLAVVVQGELAVLLLRSARLAQPVILPEEALAAAEAVRLLQRPRLAKLVVQVVLAVAEVEEAEWDKMPD